VPPYARILSLLLTATLPLPLFAALPELSSIEPLEFDEKAQRLVARGDARLDFGDARISADRITYYQEYSLADALGNVTIIQDGYRLVADRLTFDAQNNTFAVDILRTGQWPFYLSAATAGGTPHTSTIEGATLYYGTPTPFSLSMNSDLIEYSDEGNGSLKMGATTFRLGRIPLFYLPSYTYHMNGAPYYVDAEGGNDSQFGAYLQTTTLFPITPGLRAGANLDLYSKRGLLVGPAAQYTYDSENQRIVGAINTGYINDQGDPATDIFDDPIDTNRGFSEWRHQHHIGERVNVTASVSHWSDSEVTRDFRKAYYRDNQQPDSFFEGVYSGDNYYLSTFARFRPNDFQLIQERLPELRYDLLPVPVFDTGSYHRLSANYGRLREDFGGNIPTITAESQFDRFDLTYRIEHPIRLTDWLTLTPLAGARVTHYENQEIDPTALNSFSATPAVLNDDQYTREIYELGFDLEARSYATYATQNSIWDIDGLRHLARPLLRYRYFSDPDALNQIAQIDRAAFDLSRPLLDLSDLRNTDSIEETHLARLGVENLFQTRAQGYGSRTLAALNFYQDILFERGTRYDSEQQDTFHASWVELVLTPAPWLKFDLASRFKTESMTMEEVRTRTTITSGEIWEIGLSSNLLNDRIDQYRLDFIYRVNERYSFLTDLRYDAETGQFTETEIGIHTRIGNTWELIYALTFRQDASRESDVEFNVRFSLSDY
jgi:LPS-assembly protein